MKIVSAPKLDLARSGRSMPVETPIGQVKTLGSHAPELVARLGADMPVGALRSAFGGLEVSAIAALPKAQRVAMAEAHLASLGLPNEAAKAAMTAALFGALGDKVMSGSSYYVQIGGKKLDRAALAGFLSSIGKPGDHFVSAAEAKSAVVPRLADGPGLTAAELETYLFAMRHLPVTDLALRSELIPALREATGAPLVHLGAGEQGFEFLALYDHLSETGRLPDLYAAKADMTNDELMSMWDGGITLSDLNVHLEKALAPKTATALAAQFGADQVGEVKAWLTETGDKATLKRLAAGKVSPGEMQNLIYGSWKMANTPYDPAYTASYQPFPVSAKQDGAPKTVDALLGRLEANVAKQDWKAALELFDPANRAVQKELGIGDAQYLAEGLGLNMVGNSLPGDVGSFATLGQIASISVGRSESAPGTFSGEAILKDGSKLDVQLFIEQGMKGPRIAPAVG